MEKIREKYKNSKLFLEKGLKGFDENIFQFSNIKSSKIRKNHPKWQRIWES